MNRKSHARKSVGMDGLRCDGTGPIWLQIRRAISGMIASGAWSPGTRIPSEIELTKHFGVSRMTANRAIQSLALEGHLERHRRIGTIVASRAQERPAFEIWDVREIIERSGERYAYQLLEQMIVPEEDERRDLFNVRRETSLLWLRCLHLSDDIPFQLEERLVNVDAAPEILGLALDQTPPGPWLVDHVPWSQAEHTISAVPAATSEADALDLNVGTSCLVVERRTWNGEIPVTLAKLWHPGSRYRLKGQFEPVR
ncbi:MAG: GntR family histidine utilization transcriptional repressor [Parasphingorhabdus sp.]|jgi:GntR family histidine utilization transcriptional repressor|uniref:UTRA domain-containing protein n=1 Tax=Parasphingorhabdus sp. TaxID=2709688 RepID=UPI0039E331C1